MNFDEQFDEVFGKDDREQAKDYAQAEDALRNLFNKARYGYATDDDVSAAKQAAKLLGYIGD